MYRVISCISVSGRSSAYGDNIQEGVTTGARSETSSVGVPSSSLPPEGDQGTKLITNLIYVTVNAKTSQMSCSVETCSVGVPSSSLPPEGDQGTKLIKNLIYVTVNAKTSLMARSVHQSYIRSLAIWETH